MYKKRIEALSTWMKNEHIAMAVFTDFESGRDSTVRYLTGNPSDAVLCVSADGKTILAAWDINLAQKYAEATGIIAFTDFGRKVENVINLAAHVFRLEDGDRIEIPSATSYPAFLHLVEELSPFDVVCRNNGTISVAAALRAIKDDDEIQRIKHGAAITNDIISRFEKRLMSGHIKTEYDAASFVEREALAAGCEGLGFTTLAAGPDRSYCIHAFPAYTAASFGGDGFSILDFGVIYEGYTTDVTLTVAGGTLSRAQQRQLNAVCAAYDASLELYKPGVSVRTAAKKAHDIFLRGKRNMPHALGHGIGLEAHENPIIKDADRNDTVFAPGMVCTLEPGLYDPKLGGCRLENDILITEDGNELLTLSHIIYR